MVAIKPDLLRKLKEILEVSDNYNNVTTVIVIERPAEHSLLRSTRVHVVRTPVVNNSREPTRTLAPKWPWPNVARRAESMISATQLK